MVNGEGDTENGERTPEDSGREVSENHAAGNPELGQIPERALVVDDEAHIRAVFGHILKQLGIGEVRSCNRGDEALNMIDEYQPGLVLMDVNMPGIDGIQTLRGIRRKMPHVRVVVITAVATRRSVVDAIEAGATGYIRKDTPLNEIRRRIVELLGKEAQNG